ncbi:hypothetical protein [Mesorhizobium amorphae]|uniref:hypothetical protein n=1 Tax=Mesorhizobium amorphae TaxID=71433 RepID=UPI0016424CAF|nr:hypothetical protein [Mesorhizobium amorphae]
MVAAMAGIGGKTAAAFVLAWTVCEHPAAIMSGRTAMPGKHRRSIERIVISGLLPFMDMECGLKAVLSSSSQHDHDVARGRRKADCFAMWCAGNIFPAGSGNAEPICESRGHPG